MKLKYVIAISSVLLAAGCDTSNNSGQRRDAIPFVNAIPDQDTTANQQSMAIAFTVSDEQVDNVTLTAMSDNQDVVPDAGLSLGGAGANRTLTVIPTIDMLGDAIVTIGVTDVVGQSSSTSFLLTVVPQQESLQQWTREMFIDDEAGDAALINAVMFDQDADNDDFADLLQ